MSELKSCPFCGGEATLHINVRRVSCNTCYIGTGAHSTKSSAIEAWNTRVSQPQEPVNRKLVEALEEISLMRESDYETLEMAVDTAKEALASIEGDGR